VTGARYRLSASYLLACICSARKQAESTCGSDAYGRDQFSRILYGGQISLLAGLLGRD